MMDLVKLQVESGYEVKIVCLKGEDYWATSYQQLGVQLIALDIKNYLELLSEPTLRQLIKKFKPDFIHAHLPPAELYVYFSTLGNPKQKIVITKHSSKCFSGLPFENIILKILARRASVVIAISGALQQFYTDKGIPADKLKTVHYGIDFKIPRYLNTVVAEKLKKEIKKEGDELIFGTLSRLVPQKSLKILIEAFHIYTHQSLQRSRLIIAGRGVLLKELQHQVSALELEDRVSLIGFKEEAYELMSLLDVFVLASAFEGFGLVLLEAMLLGTPIVATKGGAIPEVVQEAGLLVEPGNAQQLAGALLKMEDDARRRSLSETGRKRVEQAFSLEKMFAETDKIYREILGKKDRYQCTTVEV